MRIKDLITESDYQDTTLTLGRFRGPYDPRTMQQYSAEYADSSELIDVVEDLIDRGQEPEIISFHPDQLTATQDWLSNYPSDGALFPEYADRPVVLYHEQHYYILDGHHRVAKALRTNKPISVYQFNDI